MSAPAAEKVRRARRWFWIMVVTAAAAMGALYRAVKADPGPAVGLLFMLGALVLLASVTQASRIWVALEGRHGCRGCTAGRRADPGVGKGPVDKEPSAARHLTSRSPPQPAGSNYDTRIGMGPPRRSAAPL
jgi:hypothetical protein